MLIHTSFKSQSPTRTRRRPVRRRPPASRLCLESLEDRCLLSFSPAVNYPVGANPQAVVTGDFNGDGRLDLAVANSASNTVSILRGNANGTFQAAQNFATGAVPRSLAVGDFNKDGKLDLVTANDGAYDVSVLSGNGDGTFRAPTSIGIGLRQLSVAVGDFNSDGKLDLAVASIRRGPGVLWGCPSSATCCSATATARSGRRVRTRSPAAHTIYLRVRDRGRLQRRRQTRLRDGLRHDVRIERHRGPGNWHRDVRARRLLHRRILALVGGRGRRERRRQGRPGDGKLRSTATSASCWAPAQGPSELLRITPPDCNPAPSPWPTSTATARSTSWRPTPAASPCCSAMAPARSGGQ